jgi:hypothetical protein
MKVFLSWSGPRSRAVASALNEWLPLVIQTIEPWFSPETEKGARWASEIAGSLEETDFGIICITRENLDSNWLHFEAGALSKRSESRACTLLLDLSPADVPPPLGQFQHTEAKRDDVRRLLGTLSALADRPLSTETLDRVFAAMWPSFEAAISGIPVTRSSRKPEVRSERDLLEEILGILRANMEVSDTRTADGRSIRDLLKRDAAPSVLERLGRLEDSVVSVKGKRLPRAHGLRPIPGSQLRVVGTRVEVERFTTYLAGFVDFVASEPTSHSNEWLVHIEWKAPLVLEDAERWLDQAYVISGVHKAPELRSQGDNLTL